MITADMIKAAVPKAIQAEREAPARRLYADTLDDALPDDEFDVDSVPADARGALAAETRAIAQDVGFNAADIGVVRDALRAERASPMDEATRIANREIIVTALNERYGDDALAMANLARRYVQQDARRGALLQGAGDAPAVVLRVVELALQARRAGRLR
jgi:hypothetical protein